MQQDLNEIYRKIEFLTGDREILAGMSRVPARIPCDTEVIEFLDDLSHEIMHDKDSRLYSDVITFAFWIRRANIASISDRRATDSDDLIVGRGVAFHIAPSNVPVNFAFSLASGLITGNTNVVRVPSRDYPQVSVIIRAINKVLSEHQNMKTYICLIRYDRDKTVNDLLSSMSDIRIIWGGDETIASVRNSALPPRGIEITFADRYSLAVINSDKYMSLDNPEQFAVDFYNDTYFSDQNACTSPKIVIWTGGRITEAKERFWCHLHELVKAKYPYQDIQGVDKLSLAYLALSRLNEARLIPPEDNLLIRIEVSELADDMIALTGNSGFFYEYNCDDLMKLRLICDDKKCQTIGILEDPEAFRPLILSGIKGIDRVVPIGKTMDFDMIWDGYDLMTMMTRVIRFDKIK